MPNYFVILDWHHNCILAFLDNIMVMLISNFYSAHSTILTGTVLWHRAGDTKLHYPILGNGGNMGHYLILGSGGNMGHYLILGNGGNMGYYPILGNGGNMGHYPILGNGGNMITANEYEYKE